ncbi:MAG: prepilin-type N-terminal cleavage/methylation domain-containing protein [Luminiphilus sp.]|nr:prepilin-type N-terminal cleavage/methylation domain-containing protein [Luminiphilus sp.]
MVSAWIQKSLAAGRAHAVKCGLKPLGFYADDERSGRGLRTKVFFPAGFTLIELIIVLGIVGVLVTLALPSYQNHLRAATARQGTLSLLAFALLQERLRMTRGEYQAGSVLLAYQPLSPRLRQHYQLIVAVPNPATGFELSLRPINSKKSYPTLILDSRGRRTPAQFWP